MAIMPNPKKDPKTGVYKIRQVIPLELRPFVEGKGELKRSLLTKDPQEAKAKAVEVNLEFQAILATARNQLALKESKSTPLTQSQIEQIARAWRLQEIARLSDPDILERYVQRELDDDGVNYEYSSHAGLYSDALEPIGVDSDKKAVYSPRRLRAAMKDIAEESLALAQVELSPEDPLYTVLCDRLAQHCVSICNIAFKATRHQIDHGINQLLVPPVHPVSTVAIDTQVVPDAPMLGEFFQKLADEQRKVNPKGAMKWRREREPVVRRFIELHGDLPLNRITMGQCVEFRNFLQLTPYRPGQEIGKLPFKEQIAKAQQGGMTTISLARVKVLINLLSGIFAKAHGDALISQNPCHGVRFEVSRVIRERAPDFTDAELNTLFISGLFTGRIRPSRAQYGEAIYWVPVLLTYTGARLEEICQLFRRDVEQNDGQWVIHIRDWDESQSVKTGKSRVVPLHPHLLELGFDRFLASCAAEGPLFPQLAPSGLDGRYSDAFGKWLGKQVRQILGPKTKSIKPLHAFRHAFITHLRALGVAEDVRNAITGHSQGSNVGRAYGSFRDLGEIISKMPRWPVPVWLPLGVDDAPAVETEVQP